jgi:hypothetical protein
MVIDDFHVVAMAVIPNKTDSPLFIDTDRVLPHSGRLAMIRIDSQAETPESSVLWLREVAAVFVMQPVQWLESVCYADS